MKTNIIFRTAACLFLLCFITDAVAQQADRKPWPVPEASKKVANPVKKTTDNLNLGKQLYAQQCKSCHGKAGEGDGPKAAELKTFPGDFTTADFHAQTDGEIFYKTSEGREDMPSFKKKIGNTEDIWALVVFIRTLNAED
jgi:mono/diheme cytochrome c family protein